MRNHRKCRGERGVALLVAVFALMLLSAIGMAMMFSANTETTINSNYREKQIATYAALAGLQEAKDRLIPGTGDIDWPTDLPATTAKNIIYILNPSGTDDVRPWHYQNGFADTELCHERIMSLTAPLSVSDPCEGSGSLPSGSNWYDPRDNSDAGYTGPYGPANINPPLAYKWTRIQLKANNNTFFPAHGLVSVSDGTQMCWNGLNQIRLPAGYTTACIPNGALTAIIVTDGGAGYTSSPAVAISAPGTGGTQATASAVVSNPGGQISGFVVETGGAGYITPPTVTVTGGGGTGAAGAATIVPEGGPVETIELVDSGNPNTACWAGPGAPTVNLVFSGGSGLGAAGTATMSSNHNCIAALSFTGGTCSTGKGDSFPISADNGFSAMVGIPNNGHLNQATVSLTNPGSGFNTGQSITTPTITFSGNPDTGNPAPTCTGVVASATMGYTITAVTKTNGGAGYTAPPNVAFSPMPFKGTMPKVTATVGAIAAGQVISIAMTNPGTGYFDPSTITVTLDGGCATVPCPTVAKAHAVFPGLVSAINLINPGSGYRSVPTVTIAGGAGITTAKAIARIQGGTYYSPVMLLTTLAVSPGGARSMAQMEVAPAIQGLALPGALTLAGPHPTFGAPNSYNFSIDGTDHPNGFIDPVKGATAPAPASCDPTVGPPHPAIGGFDNPNAPTSPTSVQTILSDIPADRAGTNYPGLQASPDVENVYGALGEQGSTPSGMETLVNKIRSTALQYTATSSTTTDPPINQAPHSTDPFWGTPTMPAINVVEGDLTFGGTNEGYGILVVTGNLTFKGNTTWNGLVLVIGKGGIYFSGGGGGTINGSVLVAQTRGPNPTYPYLPGPLLETMGSPTLDWSGGGGNGIYYDHCWADQMLNMIPFDPPVSSKPLTVLSLRTLTY